eukprot:10025367-Alexandrium_andersonii.AAC.1
MAAAPARFWAAGGVGATLPACANWWTGASSSKMSSALMMPATADASARGRSASRIHTDRDLSIVRNVGVIMTTAPWRRCS